MREVFFCPNCGHRDHEEVPCPECGTLLRGSPFRTDLLNPWGWRVFWAAVVLVALILYLAQGGTLW